MSSSNLSSGPSSTSTVLRTPPQPSITPHPSGCPHSEVVVQLSTALLIRDYPTHYKSVPIHAFQPNYHSYDDGSLLAAPFREDLVNSSATLLVLGGLATIFLRNILVSCDYIRRGKVKKKTLFYLLLASQLLAPVSLIPVIASHLANTLNCRIVTGLSYLSAMVSMGILITGILGIKAYKCLENPRIVPIVLALLQLGVSGVVILDLVQTQPFRRLSGSCIQLVNMRWTRLFVGLQLVQALFVCLCFVYASYRSHSNPVARGRISLRLSMEDMELDLCNCDDESRQAPQGRGWWDYVPRSSEATSPGRSRLGFVQRFFSWLRHTCWGGLNCKCRRANHRFDHPEDEKVSSRTFRTNELDSSPRQLSRAMSTNSAFSRLFPRMELFRQVVNDELLYTTFITATCVVIAVLVAISVNFRTCLSLTAWIAINWAFISLLLVHSLGRVIHRREREAWIQMSAVKSGLTRAPMRSSRQLSRTTNGTQRSQSLAPTRNKSLRERHHGLSNDPYSETLPFDQEKFSWQFGNSQPFPAAGQPYPKIADDSKYEEYYEYESSRRRKVSWQSNIFSSGHRDSTSVYSVDMSGDKPRPTRI